MQNWPCFSLANNRSVALSDCGDSDLWVSVARSSLCSGLVFCSACSFLPLGLSTRPSAWTCTKSCPSRSPSPASLRCVPVLPGEFLCIHQAPDWSAFPPQASAYVISSGRFRAVTCAVVIDNHNNIINFPCEMLWWFKLLLIHICHFLAFLAFQVVTILIYFKATFFGKIWKLNKFNFYKVYSTL